MSNIKKNILTIKKRCFLTLWEYYIWPSWIGLFYFLGIFIIIWRWLSLYYSLLGVANIGVIIFVLGCFCILGIGYWRAKKKCLSEDKIKVLLDATCHCGGLLTSQCDQVEKNETWYKSIESNLLNSTSLEFKFERKKYLLFLSGAIVFCWGCFILPLSKFDNDMFVTKNPAENRIKVLEKKFEKVAQLELIKKEEKHVLLEELKKITVQENENPISLLNTLDSIEQQMQKMIDTNLETMKEQMQQMTVTEAVVNAFSEMMQKNKFSEEQIKDAIWNLQEMISNIQNHREMLQSPQYQKALQELAEIMENITQNQEQQNQIDNFNQELLEKISQIMTHAREAIKENLEQAQQVQISQQELQKVLEELNKLSVEELTELFKQLVKNNDLNDTLENNQNTLSFTIPIPVLTKMIQNSTTMKELKDFLQQEEEAKQNLSQNQGNNGSTNQNNSNEKSLEKMAKLTWKDENDKEIKGKKENIATDLIEDLERTSYVKTTFEYQKEKKIAPEEIYNGALKEVGEGKKTNLEQRILPRHLRVVEKYFAP